MPSFEEQLEAEMERLREMYVAGSMPHVDRSGVKHVPTITHRTGVQILRWKRFPTADFATAFARIWIRGKLTALRSELLRPDNGELRLSHNLPFKVPVNG